MSDQLKVCLKCGDSLPATTEFFRRNNQKRDGLTPRCRACLTASDREWKLAHPESVTASISKFYSTHREQRCAETQAWRIANPEKARAIEDAKDVRKPLRHVWRMMIKRCTDPRSNRWRLYGGLGISVCERWLGKNGYENFCADMSKRPEGTTLGRFLDRGNYEPGNCEWQTPAQQAAEAKGKKAMKSFQQYQHQSAIAA
jgi:hypothetical protein